MSVFLFLLLLLLLLLILILLLLNDELLEFNIVHDEVFEFECIGELIELLRLVLDEEREDDEKDEFGDCGLNRGCALNDNDGVIVLFSAVVVVVIVLVEFDCSI